MENLSIAYVFVIIAVLVVGYRIYNLWEYFTLPTLNKYLQNNPKCRTNSGIKCNNCGSKSIRNWGITHANSFLRMHNCNHCGITLYRSH